MQLANVDFLFDWKGFGEDVRSNRLAMGWTQSELSDYLGYLGSYVSKTERGRPDNIGMKDFLRLCNLFDLNPTKYFILMEG